jgi:hypothetical protein
MIADVSVTVAVVQTLDEEGNGRILVVDGQGSMRCALLGDILAAKLHKSGFSVSTFAVCSTRRSLQNTFPYVLMNTYLPGNPSTRDQFHCQTMPDSTSQHRQKAQPSILLDR